MFKNEKLQISIVAITTAFFGQIKVTPFNDEIFRIGLGTSNFLLFLLLMHHLPYVQTGIYTGIIVVVFRVYQDWLSGNDSFSLVTSLLTHFPAFIFYVVFAFGMSRIQKRVSDYYPLILGAVVSAIDLLANLSELLFRRILLGHVTIHTNGLFVLLVVAVVRSYFIVGLFSSISINQMRSIHVEQRKRMDQMMHIGSGLYGEIFYLKKSLDTIEHIAAKNYDLYCRLKEENQKDFSLQALRCAQEIHEVKKDSQRILAGLLKLFDKDIVAEMNLSEILRFVIHSNQKYSEMLKKEIIFEEEREIDYSTFHYILLLTVLNNLVANAVEAIEDKGTIIIQVFLKAEETVFTVSDSGKGIPERDYEIIFEPGFTTKFNEDGAASTGIGLSHVRDIVQSFGGEIGVDPTVSIGNTKFIVSFPTINIKQGE